jgi:hypothetical protein
MSVTRVKVSETSVPPALVTEYSMTRTEMRGWILVKSRNQPARIP